MKFIANTPSEVRGKNIAYRPELDGIRGLSIIMIVFHHLDYVGYNYFGGRGFLGVDIFFVLSGFLITQILLTNRENKVGVGKFYLRRIARLYPMLLISVIGLSWYFRNNYQMLDRHPAVASVLYFKNFTHWGGVFGPLWSLSAEEQFYLIFPLILIFGMKFLKKNILTALFILYLFANWAYAIKLSGTAHNFNQDGIYNLVIFRPSILLIGCIIAIHKEKLEKLVAKLWWPFTIVFVGFVYATIRWQFPPLAGAATGILILMLADTSAQKNHLAAILKTLLGVKPLAIVGLLSYSIYLWHLPLIFVSTEHFAIHAIPNLWWLFAKLLVIGSVSFYLIEKPLMKMILRCGANETKR
jgi:peptidoglycan/LPS O-acetylase OafA/YrhL